MCVCVCYNTRNVCNAMNEKKFLLIILLMFEICENKGQFLNSVYKLSRSILREQNEYCLNP